MTPETRRMIQAMTLCMLILLGWSWLNSTLHPPPPRTHPVDSAPASQPRQSTIAAAPTMETTQPAAASVPARNGLHAVNAPTGESITLGLDAPREGTAPNPYLMYVQITPRGAAIEHARLTDYRNGVAIHPKNAPPDNYDLLAPLVDEGTHTTYYSLATRSVRLVADKAEIDLASTIWKAEKSRDEQGEVARFQTSILHANRPLLSVSKSYRLDRNSRALRMELSVTNLSDAQHVVVLTQEGPVGLRREEPSTDDRNAYVAAGDQAVRPQQRRSIWGQADHRQDFLSDTLPIRWAAMANKYFSCMMAPLPTGSMAFADFVKKVSLFPRFNTDQRDLGDLSLEWVLAPAAPLAPRASFTTVFDVYMGPRSARIMAATPAAVRHNFDRICSADRSPCTFEWLAQVMIKLFAALHAVLPGRHNYGWAIIVLVVIVRTILHPLTKHSQKNMAKMQKAMATLQPKLEALKKQYANDRQKLNEASLELYRSEGVNPAGNVLSCLPMMLQMPIWVALWSTLNSSIELRHEPFLLWIRDLSAPDALYAFSGNPLYIPLISWLTGPVKSLNLLPIIMGATMYLQQKYSQKLTRPATPPPPSDPDKPNPADQLASQAKMMNYMTVFFSLMFYSFPSGLNLYILTSNVFGMLEQKRIRQHLQRDEQRQRSAPPAADARKSKARSWLERMQKMAEVSRQPRRRSARR